LANNTRFGLAACVWSESIGLALDVAPRLKAGVVWVNTANQFDAACGFGGYRESGFGREGGREGLREYLRPKATSRSAAARKGRAAGRGALAYTALQAAFADLPPAVDRTP
jgi:aldehyde dehydrogenase (NAD+)